MSKMTNEEVKAFWLKHGKKPRVQICRSLANAYCVWETFTYSDPTFQRESTYRIHPDDLAEYTTPRRKLDVTKPLRMVDSTQDSVQFLTRLVVRDEVLLAFKVSNPQGDSVIYTNEYGASYEGDVVNSTEVSRAVFYAVYSDSSIGYASDSLAEVSRRAGTEHPVGFMKVTTFTDGTFKVESVG